MPKPRSPRRTLPSKPYSKPPKRTPHLPEKFKPQKPGHQFDNCYNINSRVDQYVRQMLFEVKAEVIDYDLAVANFLFETSHLALPDIPRSVEIVLNDFDVLFPLVSRDHDVLTCALQIQSTLNLHRQNPSTTTKPFALLFPNINSLKKLISERSKSPRVLESEKAIVLVDLEGRFLAMGLPPSPKYKKQTENQKSCPHKPDNHLPKADDDSPEQRALNALEGSACLHHLHRFIGPMPESVARPLPPENNTGSYGGKFVHHYRHSKLSNHSVPV